MSKDCLFCQLIEQQKLNLIYEDEMTVAFPDIDPKAVHHYLIVPRKHIASVTQAEAGDEQLLGHLFKVASQIAREKGIDQSGFRTVVNTGPDAGQTVLHIHMHLLGGEELGDLVSKA